MLPIAALLVLTSALGLTATVQVTPPRFVTRKDKAELVVTLTNTSDQGICVLTGHAGADNYFFALQLEELGGKVLWDAAAARQVVTDDLPAPTFVTLPPHGQYRAVLDWRHLYNLQPGRYKLRVMYRVEPDQERDAAGLYTTEIRKHQAFVGRVQSPAIAIESRAH